MPHCRVVRKENAYPFLYSTARQYAFDPSQDLVRHLQASGEKIMLFAARSKKGWIVVNASLVVVSIVAVLSLVLALQNSSETAFRFFFWELHGPLALFLMGTLVAGCAVGMLVMVPGAMGRPNSACSR